jgi:uncharacterized protein
VDVINDSMYVGIIRVVLQIVGARSLKDKRSVVRSFKEKAQAKLRISVAEVAAHDTLNQAVLAAAIVSKDAEPCNEVFAKFSQMANTLRDATLADVQTEIIPFHEFSHTRLEVRGLTNEDES